MLKFLKIGLVSTRLSSETKRPFLKQENHYLSAGEV